MIRILIADDHPIVRNGLKNIIQGEPDMTVVSETALGTEVFELLGKDEVSLLILDISLPGMGGMDVLERIKQDNPNFPVLMLSIYPEDLYATKAMKAGASGYLSKTLPADEILKAIRKAANKGIYVSPKYAERLAGEVKGSFGKLAHEKLSKREFDVLKGIGLGKKPGVIGEELFISIKTVHTHRAHILQKMNMKTNAELMNYCFREGLIT